LAEIEVGFFSNPAVAKIPFLGNLYNIACLPFRWHFFLLPPILQQVNHDICSDPSVCFHDFRWNIIWTWCLTILDFLDRLYYLCLGDGAKVNVQVISLLNLQWLDKWCATEQAAEVLLSFIELV